MHNYLQDGFSKEELTSIGERKTLHDIPITAHQINARPLPPVAAPVTGFDKQQLRDIAEGRMKGQVAFNPTIREGQIQSVTAFGDVTKSIPISQIEDAQDGVRELLKKGKFDGR